jgi:acyl dehydratase
MNGRITLEPIAIACTAGEAQLWSELLDDGNPLHADPEAALAHGFGRGVVTPGPANAGHLMTLLLRNFPAGSIETFRARFVAAVLAPTTVEARGTIQFEESTPTGRLVHCALELWAEGAIVVTAAAQVRISDPERVCDPNIERHA